VTTTEHRASVPEDAAGDLLDDGPLDPTVPSAEIARRLGDVLIERGVLTAPSLAAALASRSEAPAHRRRIGHLLVDRGLATENDVAQALATLLELEFVDLARTRLDDNDIRSIPRAVAEAHGLLVMARSEDGTVRIGTHDPKNVLALDDARLHTRSSRLDVVVVAETPMRTAIRHAWDASEGARTVAAMPDGFHDSDDEGDDAASADDAPIVRLAGRLLADAIRSHASDIHVEPQSDRVRVRFRIDGVLRHITDVPLSSRAALTSRLKIIAGMDIAERRLPQDGRVRLEISGEEYDARVSTLPSMHGEKVVIRLLTPSDRVPVLAELGLNDRDLATVRRVLAQPQGLVLITGPTGSGKTNTLFSALREINTPERNVVTLEDPVEIQLPGLTQVQINERTGYTFARGLRSVLRQDPDVVLVGEIRDLETAELAMRAALTGHLVLASLHTNDAISALTRLVDMGIERYVVATSLSLVVAQRLVRTVCTECARPVDLDDEFLTAIGLDAVPPDAAPREGAGCSRCEGLGYRGRRGVFEVVDVDTTLRKALLADENEHTLAALARESGTTSLPDAALALAHQGVTSYREAVRVTVQTGSSA
jgi:type IV pilus assembly protein PilB